MGEEQVLSSILFGKLNLLSWVLLNAVILVFSSFCDGSSRRAGDHLGGGAVTWCDCASPLSNFPALHASFPLSQCEAEHADTKWSYGGKRGLGGRGLRGEPRDSLGAPLWLIDPSPCWQLGSPGSILPVCVCSLCSRLSLWNDSFAEVLSAVSLLASSVPEAVLSSGVQLKQPKQFWYTVAGQRHDPQWWIHPGPGLFVRSVPEEKRVNRRFCDRFVADWIKV